MSLCARRKWRWGVAAAAASLAVASTPGIGAQPDVIFSSDAVSRPKSAERVVHAFDFEERDTNPLPVPRGWFRGQDDPAIARERPGFPIWNKAELDYEAPAYEGEGTVRLSTEGGSASLVLHKGVIPVFPGGDYLVAGAVRTEGLEHARASVAVRFLDAKGEPILDSESRSRPRQTKGHWATFAVKMLGDFPGAAYLQVELQVLQPKQLHEGPVRSFDVWPEDISGSAWFDDIRVVQLPRVEFAPVQPAGVVPGGERPVFDVAIRDLAGEALELRMRVFDASGREVAAHSERRRGGRINLRWTPELAPRFGWYQASLEVRTDDRVIARERSAFVWIDARGADPRGTAGATIISHAGERFGITLPPIELEQAESARFAVWRLGVGSLTLPVWSPNPGTGGHDTRAAALEPVIDRLIRDRFRLSLAFERAPEGLAARSGLMSDQLVGLFAGEHASWGPIADPYLDRFGQRVRRWQLGRAGDEAARGLSGEKLSSVAQAFGTLVPGPLLTVPWSADVELRGMPRGVLPAVDVGPWLGLDGITDATRAVLDRDRDKTWQQGEARFRLLRTDGDVYGHDVAAADFVRRVLAVWSVAATGPTPFVIDLVRPLEQAQGRRSGLAPTPELAALPALIARLEGREVVAAFRPAPGVEAMLLAPTGHAPPGRGSALVVWRGAPGVQDLTYFVGGNAVKGYDVFGNPFRLEKAAHGPDHAESIRVPVGYAPVFIEGVDANTVLMQSSLRLSPRLVRSHGGAVRHTISFDNPWDGSIRGRLFILEPGGFSQEGERIDRSWDIRPRVIPFVVGPGERVELPVEIACSLGEETGRKPLVFDIDLTAEQAIGLFRLERELEVGIEGIALELIPIHDPDPVGGPVVVRAEITNTGDRPADLELAAIASGYPRSKAAVGGLAPGETASRTFYFPGGEARLRGTDVAVVLTVPGSGARMSSSVPID